MIDKYEAAELLVIGKAQEVILGIKEEEFETILQSPLRTSASKRSHCSTNRTQNLDLRSIDKHGGSLEPFNDPP